jgi:hypothetical protein
MTETTHTPGPWYMEAEAYDSHYQISDDCCTTIAQVEAWDGDNDKEVMGQAKANARLIAAAPELLRVLENLADQADEDCPQENRSRHFADALETARDFIAKSKAA